MNYVIFEEFTKTYICASESKYIDKSDISFAQIYSLAGANSAAQQFNRVWKAWYKNSGDKKDERKFVVTKVDGNFFTTKLYFEAHVTIEPVFDEKLEQFKQICTAHQFRAADLLMKKRKKDTEERSQHDTFATGRDTDYMTLVLSTSALVKELQENSFQVWRYKIENTLLDSRYEDKLKLDVRPETNGH